MKRKDLLNLLAGYMIASLFIAFGIVSYTKTEKRTHQQHVISIVYISFGVLVFVLMSCVNYNIVTTTSPSPSSLKCDDDGEIESYRYVEI